MFHALTRSCRKGFGSAQEQLSGSVAWFRKVRARCGGLLQRTSNLLKPIAEVLACIRSIFVSVFVLALIILIGVVVYRECAVDTVLVLPFSVPQELGAAGYQPPVLANEFVDQLAKLQKELHTLGQQQRYLPIAPESALNIELPDTHLSIRSVVDLLRQYSSRRTVRISGDLVVSTNSLRLTLRIFNPVSSVAGYDSVSVTGSINRIDLLMRDAAEDALGNIDPLALTGCYLNEGRVSDAINTAPRCLYKATPDRRADAYCLWGYAYLLKTNYDSANIKFRQALQAKPNCSMAFDMLGTAALFQGQTSNAIAFCAKSVRADARDAQAFRNLGLAYLIQTNIDQAVAMTRRACELDPSDPLAYLNWSFACLISSNYQKGIELCNKAIEVDPDYAQSYNNLGSLYYFQSNYPSAIAAFDEGLQAVARRPASHPDSGVLPTYRFLSTEKYHPINAPVSAELYYNLGIVFCAQTNSENALSMFRKSVASDHGYAPSMYQIADILFSRRDFAGAETELADALRADPSLSDADVLMGRVLTCRTNFSAACTYFERASKLAPNDALLWYLWGVAEGKLHHDDLAISKYTEAVRLDPSFSAALVNWGETLRNRGDYDAAIPKFKQANALDSALLAPVYDMGLCYLEKQDYGNAVDMFKRTTEIDPKFTMAYAYWARTLEIIGDEDGAEEKYFQALQISPHFDEHTPDEISDLLESGRPIP